MTTSPLDLLQATNPLAEIWWDSSPLVFPQWRDELVSAAAPGAANDRRDQLDRLMSADVASAAHFRGCTTNPPLSLTAVKRDPTAWNERIDALAVEHPGLDAASLSWVVYKEIIARGAAAFHALWEASSGRYGYVSGQLDPRLITETETMIRQAREIASIAPNVMVKVPASSQGIEVLRTITGEGIPTNVTTCFTTAQVMAAARATAEGVDTAQRNGVDMRHWRAVITLMLARLTEREVIRQQAAERGVPLSPADLKWFGIAVFKHSYRLLRDGGFPSKLLLCSVRPGPVVAGRTAFWDVEEVAGANIVYTLPPAALTPLFELAETLEFDPGAIDREVPAASLARILQTPYGIQSYDPNGMSQDQFNLHPATIFTAAEFSKSASGLEDYVAGRLDVTSDTRKAQMSGR